jgi:hypothetical protein
VGRIGLAVAAATVIELAMVIGLVHVVLSYPMLARGMSSWKVSDTLLVSPLMFLGVTIFSVSVNSAIAVVALRVARGTAEPRIVSILILIGVVLGGLWAAFGVRAVGKLY